VAVPERTFRQIQSERRFRNLEYGAARLADGAVETMTVWQVNAAGVLVRNDDLSGVAGRHGLLMGCLFAIAHVGLMCLWRGSVTIMTPPAVCVDAMLVCMVRRVHSAVSAVTLSGWSGAAS
jgi:hypothetical protein